MASKLGKKLNLASLKVNYEDSEPSSFYFAVSDFNPNFTSGKNAFSINGTKYLKKDAPIFVEVVDAGGNSLYTEIARFSDSVQYKDNNAIVVAIHVYQDTVLGKGKVYLVSQLALDSNNKPVSSKANIVRWSVPIYIDSSKVNVTKVKFYATPKLIVENKFSRIVAYTTGSAEEGTDIGTCYSVAESPQKGFNFSLFNPFSQQIQYRIDKTSGPPFSSSFAGLQMIFDNIFIDDGRTGSFYNGTFTSTIKEVINNHSLLLTTPFTTSDNNTNTINTIKSADYFITHFPIPTLVPEDEYINLIPSLASTSSINESQVFYKSIAAITLDDIETFSGNVYRFRMYRRSQNSKIDSECIADELVQGKEMLIDSTNPNRFRELMGVFYDQSHINNYWETSSNLINIVSDDNLLIDSMHIVGSNDLPHNSAFTIVKDDSNIFYGRFIKESGSYEFQLYRHVDPIYYNYYNPAYNIDDTTLYSNTASQTANSTALQSNLDYLSSNFMKFYKNVEYQISANVIGNRTITPTNQFNNGLLTFYLTGSRTANTQSLFGVTQTFDGIGVPILTASMNSGSSATYFGKISSTFTLNDDMTGTIFLMPSFGEFFVSQISIVPYEEKSYNAGVVAVEVPFPVDISNENFTIRAELFDVNSNQIPVTLEVSQFFDTLGKTIIKPTYSINSITVQSAFWDAIIGKPYLISSSLQFTSADNATFGNLHSSFLTVPGISNVTASLAVTASYAKTASFLATANNIILPITSSWSINSQNSISSSYSILSAGAISSSHSVTSDFSTMSSTASFAISSSLASTASFIPYTSSYDAPSSLLRLGGFYIWISGSSGPSPQMRMKLGIPTSEGDGNPVV
jgi:hypothetical protein